MIDTGLVQGTAMYGGALERAGRYDPGPVPESFEPHPSSVVLVADGHTSVEVTRNIGHTGLPGLTVTRGESSVAVALPPATVDALRQALAEATPIPYLPATPTRGGRW